MFLLCLGNAVEKWCARFVGFFVEILVQKIYCRKLVVT